MRFFFARALDVVSAAAVAVVVGLQLVLGRLAGVLLDEGLQVGDLALAAVLGRLLAVLVQVQGGEAVHLEEEEKSAKDEGQVISPYYHAFITLITSCQEYVQPSEPSGRQGKETGEGQRRNEDNVRCFPSRNREKRLSQERA